MSKEKLLLQVELLPPTEGNKKTVADQLSSFGESQKQVVKGTKSVTRATKKQSEEFLRFEKQIEEVRLKMKETEEQARFYNASTDEGISSLKAQGSELLKLRKEIKASGLEWKELTKLQKRATAGIKQSNLGVDRLKNNFTSMSAATGRANQSMVALGRIVQDLPYGFIGISNNIEESAMSMSRLIAETGGLKGAMGALSKSMMGSAGILFLLGSALPFAMTVSTAGFPGFRNMMNKSKKDSEDLEGSIKSLTDSLIQLEVQTGNDPTGILGLEGEIRAIRRLETGLEDALDLQDRIESTRDQISRSGRYAGRIKTEVSLLEQERRVLLDNLGITKEQFDIIKERGGTLEEQLETAIKQLQLSELSEFQFMSDKRVGELQDLFSLGIRSTEEGGTIQRVEDLRDKYINLSRSLQLLVEQGNDEVMPYLKVVNEAVKSLSDTLDQIPEKPKIKIEAPDPEIIEGSMDLDDELVASMKITGGKELQRDLDRRLKQIRKFEDQTFRIRVRTMSETQRIEETMRKQLQDVDIQAQELGLENHRSVEQLKTAITEHAEIKRKEYAIQQQEELAQERIRQEQMVAESQMELASLTGDFVSSVSDSIASDSKALALLQLTVQKGLKIGEVVTNTASKISELQSVATIASAKASLATASGNFPQGIALNTASLQAKAQIAHLKAQSSKAIGLITATGLAEGAGVAFGDSGGSSGGGNRSSGMGGRGSGDSEGSMGFSSDDKDKGEFRRVGNKATKEMSKSPDTQGEVIVLNVEWGDKASARKVRRGNRLIRNENSQLINLNTLDN